MSLTTADAITELLGRADTYTAEQKREAAAAATNYIKKVCNREFEQQTYNYWLPKRGAVVRSGVCLPEYPLIGITGAYRSAMTGCTVTVTATGAAICVSVVDGVLYGACSATGLTLSDYATLTLLKAAVEAGGTYTCTVANEGDPVMLRHTGTTGECELPTDACNLEVVDYRSSHIVGPFVFVRYLAGYATIPDDLEHVATRVALSFLQHGQPSGAGHGTQLDAATFGFDVYEELRPYMRIEFGAWGDGESGQVTTWGRAGWSEI